MLKGVNKNVIEILDTGNDCFERVILFVRPESQSGAGDDLYTKAKVYLANLRFRRRMLYGGGSIFLGIIKILAIMALGAFLALMFLR